MADITTQAVEPALRPGAEVPRDEGHAGRASGAPARTRRVRAGDAQGLMHGQGQARGPSKPAGPMPATDDEIREKYLERAIRELNHAHPRGAELPPLPARRPHARAGLRPPAGRHPAPQARAGARRRSRRAWPSTAAPATALMKSLKRLSIDPLAVYGTLCVKCPVGDPSLADPACVARRGRGARDRPAPDRRRHGRRRAGRAQRPRRPAARHGRAARRRRAAAHAVDRGARTSRTSTRRSTRRPPSARSGRPSGCSASGTRTCRPGDGGGARARSCGPRGPARLGGGRRRRRSSPAVAGLLGVVALAALPVPAMAAPRAWARRPRRRRCSSAALDAAGAGRRPRRSRPSPTRRRASPSPPSWTPRRWRWRCRSSWPSSTSSRSPGGAPAACSSRPRPRRPTREPRPAGLGRPRDASPSSTGSTCSSGRVRGLRAALRAAPPRDARGGRRGARGGARADARLDHPMPVLALVAARRAVADAAGWDRWSRRRARGNVAAWTWRSRPSSTRATAARSAARRLTEREQQVVLERAADRRCARSTWPTSSRSPRRPSRARGLVARPAPPGAPGRRAPSTRSRSRCARRAGRRSAAQRRSKPPRGDVDLDGDRVRLAHGPLDPASARPAAAVAGDVLGGGDRVPLSASKISAPAANWASIRPVAGGSARHSRSTAVLTAAARPCRACRRP